MGTCGGQQTLIRYIIRQSVYVSSARWTVAKGRDAESAEAVRAGLRCHTTEQQRLTPVAEFFFGCEQLKFATSHATR